MLLTIAVAVLISQEQQPQTQPPDKEAFRERAQRLIERWKKNPPDLRRFAAAPRLVTLDPKPACSAVRVVPVDAQADPLFAAPPPPTEAKPAPMPVHEGLPSCAAVKP